MLKKTLFVGAGLVLLLGLLFGRDAIGLSKALVSNARETVSDAVPLPLRIDQARKQIANLEPVIRKNMTLIAKEEVKVEKLEQEVGNSQALLAKAQDNILRLKEDLESGNSSFVYVGVSYTSKEVENDLRKRFAEYKTKEATVESLQKVLQARRNSLQAARDQLVEIRSQKRNLEVKVENLQARLKMIEVAQTSTGVHLDDSHLSRTKELIDTIDARLRTQEKLLNVDHKIEPRIQLEEPEVKGDISAEITDYFGTRPEGRELVRTK